MESVIDSITSEVNAVDMSEQCLENDRSVEVEPKMVNENAASCATNSSEKSEESVKAESNACCGVNTIIEHKTGVSSTEPFHPHAVENVETQQLVSKEATNAECLANSISVNNEHKADVDSTEDANVSQGGIYNVKQKCPAEMSCLMSESGIAEYNENVTNVCKENDPVTENCATEAPSEHAKQEHLTEMVLSDKPHTAERIFDECIYRDDTDSDSDSLSSLSSNSLSLSSVSSLSDVETTKSVKNKETRTKGELGLDDLPKIEDLNIEVPESEIQIIGSVSSIVGQLVVVETFKNLRALDLDSVLFLANGKPLGKIYDVFGPVVAPLYAVRFNSKEDIEERVICVHDPVYFAPSHKEMTQYVFIENLQKEKGSDASWVDNNEPPVECLDYSDDEQERSARQKHRAKNRERSNDDDDDEDSDVVKKKVAHRYSAQPAARNVPQNFNANLQQHISNCSRPERSNFFQRPVSHSFRERFVSPLKTSPFSSVSNTSAYNNASAANMSRMNSPLINQSDHRGALPPSPFGMLRPAVFRPPPPFPNSGPPPSPISRPPPPQLPTSEFNAFPRDFSAAEHQNLYPVPAFSDVPRHVPTLPPHVRPNFGPPAFNHAPPILTSALRQQVPPPNLSMPCSSSGLPQSASIGRGANMPLSTSFPDFPRPPPPSGAMSNSFSPPQLQNGSNRTPFAPVVGDFPRQMSFLNPVHSRFSSPPPRGPGVNMPYQQFRAPPPAMHFQSPASSGQMNGNMLCQRLPPPPPPPPPPYSANNFTNLN